MGRRVRCLCLLFWWRWTMCMSCTQSPYKNRTTSLKPYMLCAQNKMARTMYTYTSKLCTHQCFSLGVFFFPRFVLCVAILKRACSNFKAIESFNARNFTASDHPALANATWMEDALKREQAYNESHNNNN